MEAQELTQARLDDFAVRSFRDQADQDYIAARIAFRTKLVSPALWSSLQSLEKYMKCALLLKRVPAKSVGHSLIKAFDLLKDHLGDRLELAQSSRQLIDHLERFGESRYLEISTFVHGKSIISLDRAVWELRRFCTTESWPETHRLPQGELVPRVCIEGGLLEQILADKEHPARQELIRQNAFFGKRARRKVKYPPYFHAINSPLFLYPEVLDEVTKYVFLPRGIAEGYRALAAERNS